MRDFPHAQPFATGESFTACEVSQQIQLCDCGNNALRQFGRQVSGADPAA